MKKPDRWERIASKAFPDVHFTTLTEAHEVRQDVAKLLRQEHRWVRRMVLEESKSPKPKMDIYGQHCMQIQARDILAKLKERSK